MDVIQANSPLEMKFFPIYFEQQLRLFVTHSFIYLFISKPHWMVIFKRTEKLLRDLPTQWKDAQHCEKIRTKTLALDDIAVIGAKNIWSTCEEQRGWRTELKRMSSLAGRSWWLLHSTPVGSNENKSEKYETVVRSTLERASLDTLAASKPEQVTLSAAVHLQHTSTS